MKKILITLLFLFLGIGVQAQFSPGQNHAKQNIDCKTCHVCNVPTKQDPCLIPCPRERIVTVYQKPEKTPELIVMDEITDRYGPVYFSHRIHAQMSDMSGGCENCHHYNTTGPILKCNSCHESVRKRSDVSIPDLKGAYHRQCMNCHREWSHETGCNTCHLLTKDIKEPQADKYRSQLAGKVHPKVEEPVKILYETDYQKGKLVTFYHDDHTKKFKIDCISCHAQESCTKCHDVNLSNQKSKLISEKKSVEEHHKKCFSCHQNDNCSNCHLDKELERFDHERKTGWALNKYHIILSCEKCHGSKIPYKTLDKNCISCHGEWNSENFKHSVTGLQLDEVHIELSCEDCHIDKNFAVKPSCDGCHEGFSFPKNKPGKLINR
jgi:hypothetical protein